MNRVFLLLGLLSSVTLAQFAGRVLDQDNNPLPGTIVYDITNKKFEVLNNETTLTEHLTRAICDRKGYFTLKSDAVHPLLVARDMKGDFSILTDHQTSGDSSTFIFREPAVLTGKIMKGPFPGINTDVTVVNLEYPQNFSYSFKTRTDQGGEFRIENIMPGSCDVLIFEDIPAIGCMSTVVTKRKPVTLIPGQSAYIQLGGHDMPSLSGRITTPDNKPLHGVWVKLNPEQPAADSETCVWADVSGSNGYYSIYDIPPGNYNVECIRRLAKNTPTRVLKKNIQIQIEDKAGDFPLFDKQPNGRQQTLDIQIDIDPFMPLTVGQKAPDFEAETIDGKEWSLSQHRGKTVVLHFYTTKCKYCKANFAGFENIYNTLRSDVEVLGVSLDKTFVECQNFLAQTSATHPQIFEGTAPDISALYRVSDVPTSFVIDKKGNIAQIDLFGTTLVKFIKGIVLVDN